MSKGLGWAIKLISWGAIYFIFSMSFGGDMPFWVYFIVVFLCLVVQGIVDRFVKKDPEEEDESTVESQSKDKQEDNKSAE